MTMFPDHPMTTTETTYLSIKEAAERYKKSEITIRRLVRSIVNDMKSGDRPLITPNVKEAKQLKSKRHPFSYGLSVELLEKHFCSTHEAPRAARLSQGPDFIRLLEKTNETLQHQVQVKDEQIRSLQHSIDGLGERQREMNILMKGLQQQLLLASGQQDGQRKRWWKWWSEA
jgi:hypothetical protein